MSDIFRIVVETLKIIFPAYCANAIPVLAGGGLPIDFGKKFIDKKPIFGENKTYKGFISGLAAGTLVGIIENAIFRQHPQIFGFLTSMGALLGDLIGAFIKRRVGIAPGKPLPVVDQIDFIVGALLFAYPLGILSSELVLAALIITPPIHFLTNFAAYKLGLKSNPW